ncbi:unnamed protein product [Peronospora belbahrii]|uniref:Uncharacterized protein n=2 Tax=Peronospora belbahrii TaxID=622444 RepID=A0AAU9L5W9_9STRA|nr:unnamed protein product [Peronospora belbahrii]
MTRFWKFKIHLTPKEPKVGPLDTNCCVSALEFSPEGDWLAALSQKKTELYLIPVLTLIANQRRAMLAASSNQTSSYYPEVLNVSQAVMTIPMASYLRVTNEYGGLHGARYHSQVTGDEEQMSLLEFAPGLGEITCLRWWRSFHGKNYCLVGSTESLISIVNVEENAEECRCELMNAGKIISIELLQEKFKKERRTSMLVKTKMNCEDKQTGKKNCVKYYRVVLEKKGPVGVYGPLSKKGKKSDDEQKVEDEKDKDEATRTASTLKIATTTGGLSSSGETKFTTANIGSGLSSSISHVKVPKFVVKTFPQHFLQDLDFRPQRIKKNSPHVCLYPINGVLSSESSLALYDCKKKTVSLYSNFHWRLKGEYEIPDLLPLSSDDTDEQDPAQSSGLDSGQQEEGTKLDLGEGKDEVVDVDMTYCSTDLMLLQGRLSKSNKTVSMWVSLPSNQGMDEDVARAHIVHYLSLHGNEKVERVVQSTARSRGGLHRGGSQTGEAEIIYILQTKHHVYECRPQWSRLALFKALCAQSIALRDALSIGYALGIDMASLCEVVANTLYTSVIDGSASANGQLVQWVRDLFEVSRVMPSSAVEQLTRMGGVQSAIDYAEHVLSKPAIYDKTERGRVALMLVDLALQQQLQKSTSLSIEAGQEFCTQEWQDEEKEAWLVNFLETNCDYMTADIVDLCLSQHNVDKAILVAARRDEVPQVLEKIVDKGLASFVSEQMLRSLLESGHAAAFTFPPCRLILRSFPIEIQAEVLLAYPPAILQHRGWLERNMPLISLKLCRELAAKIDPMQSENNGCIVEEYLTEKYSDVSMSEFIRVSPEEQVELYLTLLLRLNWNVDIPQREVRSSHGESDDAYSQGKLEMLMKDLAARYRSPIMVARCVDYENWTAAACIYEAHGELVEALECRLHSHNAHNMLPHLTSTGGTIDDSTHFDDSIGSAVSDRSKFHRQMREELLGLLTSLVVRSHSSEVISEQVRAAILARILVKWFDYGLERTELEDFLIDPNVFAHVSSLMAQIFFFEVAQSILGPDLVELDCCQGFDDRDKEWVLKCQHLPYSGQFLFQVCVYFLETNHYSPEMLDSSSRSPMLKLLDVVKNNAIENDLSHGVVAIAPHSAQALGKTDPLETHVKAFTCGHLFPKRVFEEEVVSEFEKRMNALPMPLFATKQAFTREFKRGTSETPCPVCSYNKISQLVLQQHKTTQREKRVHGQKDRPGINGVSPLQGKNTRQQLPYYFLHRETSESLGFLAEIQTSKPVKHEAWE